MLLGWTVTQTASNHLLHLNLFSHSVKSGRLGKVADTAGRLQRAGRGLSGGFREGGRSPVRPYRFGSGIRRFSAPTNQDRTAGTIRSNTMTLETGWKKPRTAHLLNATLEFWMFKAYRTDPHARTKTHASLSPLQSASVYRESNHGNIYQNSLAFAKMDIFLTY